MIDMKTAGDKDEFAIRQQALLLHAFALLGLIKPSCFKGFGKSALL